MSDGWGVDFGEFVQVTDFTELLPPYDTEADEEGFSEPAVPVPEEYDIIVTAFQGLLDELATITEDSGKLAELERKYGKLREGYSVELLDETGAVVDVAVPAGGGAYKTSVGFAVPPAVLIVGLAAGEARYKM